MNWPRWIPENIRCSEYGVALLGLVIEEAKPPAINKGLNPPGTIPKKVRILFFKGLVAGSCWWWSRSRKVSVARSMESRLWPL